MSTTSTSGWNRPQQNAQKVTPKKPSAMRGVVAGLVVVALAAVCVLIFTGKDKKPVEKVEKERGRIKEVKPAVAPKVEPEKPKAEPEVKDIRITYKPDEVFRDKYGVLRYKADPSLRAFDPKVPAHEPVYPGHNRPPLFKHTFENELAAILDMTPGERRLISPNYYDPEFAADFENSLADTIEIKDSDLPHEVEMKKAVAELKEELGVRVGKGEKIADILTEAKRDLERLVEYKDNLKDELTKLVRDGKGTISNEDVLDYVKAANKMLEENGVNPVEPDNFVVWNVRMAAENAGASPEEVNAAENATAEKLEEQRREASKTISNEENK